MDTHRQTPTDRDRAGHTRKHGDNSHTETHRGQTNDTNTHRQGETDVVRDTDRDRYTDTQTHRHIRRHTDRDKRTQTYGHAQTQQIQADTDRHKQTWKTNTHAETQMDRHK